MSAKKIVELTYAWFGAQEKLVESQKRVTHLTLRLARLEEEIEDLRRENRELRIPLLCDTCRMYLQSKLSGDTIEVCPCAKCIGIR